MGLLPTAVGLGDVQDLDGFVNAAINREPRLASVPAGEREELAAEGFLIMCELWRRFTPYGPWSSFDRYANEFLPRRLVDAWHRLHRGEHVRRPNRGGHRVWEIRSIASFDQELLSPAFSELRLRRVGEFEPVPLAA
jgi:hypothetical protein